MHDTRERTFSGPSGITKARGSATKISKGVEHDRDLSRRPPLRYTTRRSILSRLDTWLSGMLPGLLRAGLSNIPFLPTLIFVYCLLSVPMFSGYIFSCLLAHTVDYTVASPELSTLNSLPLDHMLSKVSSLRPSPLVDPDVLSTRVSNPTFSACLWATEVEAEMIATWAARWTGHISFVVTTTAAPSSPGHMELLTKLAQIQGRSPLLEETLSVHILHVDPATEAQPNAFLNIARLLAPSPLVVLFPGNLSSVPPKSLYRTLVSLQPSSSSAISQPGRKRKRKPILLTQRDHMSFPFAPLAPLVYTRDDPTWCTERFFAGMSRVADWEECLWQVWLANFGDLEVRQAPGWASIPQQDEMVVGTGSQESPAAVKLHRRLVSKFKSETCALAVRRFAALRDPDSSADTKKARWLKRVCRGWSPA